MTNFIEKGCTMWARQTIDSDIFHKSDKRFKIRFYIVSRVNHKDNNKRKRGECHTSYEEIMVNTKAKKNQVYKCIKWLKDCHMVVTKKKTRGFTLKVLNYGIYQDLKNYKEDTKKTDGRQTEDREEDTKNKNERMKEGIIVSKDTTTEVETFGSTNLNDIDETLKRHVEKYGMIYKTDRNFLKHMTSKKRKSNSSEKGYTDPIKFACDIVTASMQNQTKYDKRFMKVNSPKVIYQNFSEIINDYQKKKQTNTPQQKFSNIKAID